MEMETGDLIFTQIGRSDNAISSVTEGYKGARVNHVGVIIKNQLGFFILEAFPPEVRLTNIDVYIRRSQDMNSKPRYISARLKDQYKELIPNAIQYGLQQRDIPYDQLYLTGESQLYCSELVVDMFKYANGGDEFFLEFPMSFRNIETGKIHDDWVNYYDYFGMPVPEGKPGSNPGDISKDEKIEVYNIVGSISGYNP